MLRRALFLVMGTITVDGVPRGWAGPSRCHHGRRPSAQVVRATEAVRGLIYDWICRPRWKRDLGLVLWANRAENVRFDINDEDFSECDKSNITRAREVSTACGILLADYTISIRSNWATTSRKGFAGEQSTGPPLAMCLQNVSRF